MRRADHLPPVRRVGHKGADQLALGNTEESFQAALDSGVDMIEFDVLKTADGRLVLAHDPIDAESRDTMTLDEGLDLFASEAYAGVELDVDMKHYGYEREVAEGLAERGLVERSLVSSTYLRSLDRIGETGHGFRRGWSVPRAKRDYTRSVLAPGAYALLMLGRAALPNVAARFIREGRIEAVMSHYLLASGRLVEAVRNAGGSVYVWTVDDARRIEQLDALGVDGVITNDPGLFEPAPVAERA
jgi:glycerophosphoryl diester phosphodiesterase